MVFFYIQGDVKLPGLHEMRADIDLKKMRMADRFVKTQRHTIQVDYIPFMDELAELCGCQPNLCMYTTNFLPSKIVYSLV